MGARDDRVDACIERSVDFARPIPERLRLARAVEWIAEGKPRNWKYM